MIFFTAVNFNLWQPFCFSVSEHHIFSKWQMKCMLNYILIYIKQVTENTTVGVCFNLKMTKMLKLNVKNKCLWQNAIVYFCPLVLSIKIPIIVKLRAGVIFSNYVSNWIGILV